MQDFYNLVDVYMDAVFHPRLTPQVLQQEGWHLEVEPATEGEAASAPQLSYQGVVFNEMKGVFSSASSVHHEQAQSALFPDTTYRHCSGGDPAVIPDLTFEQFSGFHQQFYHPRYGHRRNACASWLQDLCCCSSCSQRAVVGLLDVKWRVCTT